MSNHWHEWQYAAFHPRHRDYPAVSKHRVAKMIEAGRVGWENFRTIADGRTVCGRPIRRVDQLAPNPPRMSAYETWVEGWRPCQRCFPDFDLATARRMVAIDRSWSEKGERQMERVSHLLWNVVTKHRAPSETSGGKR